MSGRDFTLCRQFYTARKLTESHGIMSKVEIDIKNLGIPLLLFLFVCLFVCLFVFVIKSGK